MNRAKWFKKGLLELVGRSAQIGAGDSATPQCVTGYRCNVQARDAVQPKSETNHTGQFKKVWLNLLVEVTQIGPHIRQRTKVLRSITAMYKSNDVQQGPNMTQAEFYEASACAGELRGLAELFKELHFTTFQFVSRWIQIRQDTFNSAEDPANSSISKIRCLATQQWTRGKTSIGGASGHERQYCRSLHETSK